MIHATLHRTLIAVATPLLLRTIVAAQCTDYFIFMEDDPNASDVSWSFVDQSGITVLSGSAPFSTTICLPDGCYTLLMFDSGGDDWEGLDWEIEQVDGPWSDHTTLNNSSQAFEQFELGDGDCDPGGGDNCSGGQNPFYIASNPGGSPAQMAWTLSLNGVLISSGGPTTNDTLCLDPTCLVLVMTDSGSNGWQGGSIVITNEDGTVVYAGTLATGATQTVHISIDGGSCLDPGGGGPGGGGVPGTGPGGGCSDLPPGGDCATAGCACDPFTFQIAPSGFGNVNEVPASGTLSNPSFFGTPPWGGPVHSGCLLAGELNSTWIAFTVEISGMLQFAFGAGGQQVGFYDWAMWPLAGSTTCGEISTNSLQPVRCVWNATTIGGTGIASPLPAGGNVGNYDAPLPVTAGQRFIICFSNWSFVNAPVTLDFFGTAAIQCGPTPLPVELLSFTAFNDGPLVRAEWTTGSERNSDHFEVERSTDTETWSSIGSVQGAGTSQQEHQYVFDDTHPLHGQSYYRLRQVDSDGTMTLSSMSAVYRSGMTEVSAWPMPNQGMFNVTGMLGALHVFNALGQKVPLESTGPMNGDERQVRILAPEPGLYFLSDDRGAGTALRLLVDH